MYISDSKLTPRHFYKGLLEQLGFDSKWHSGDAKRQLHKEIELIKLANGPMPIVIVDEAHLLSRDMLEEVRFLLNFRMDSQSPMALILSGQPELWDKLKRKSHAAILQRIDVKCGINRLSQSKNRSAVGTTWTGHKRRNISSHILTSPSVNAIFLPKPPLMLYLNIQAA